MKVKKATKADVISCVTRDSRFSKHQVKLLLNLTLQHVQSLLIERGAIEMRGFGTFYARTRRARANARNPRTGEPAIVKARRVVVFRPGTSLRNAIAPIPDHDAHASIPDDGERAE